MSKLTRSASKSESKKSVCVLIVRWRERERERERVRMSDESRAVRCADIFVIISERPEVE